MDGAKKARRRRHGEQLKRQVLSECAEAGASVARVALAHGLNANLVHKWRRHAERPTPQPTPSTFVPVMIAPAPKDAVATEPIRLELRRGSTTVAIAWPHAVLSELAAFTRELLR